MALVELTPRAEKSLLELLGKSNRLEDSLLVVDMHDPEAQLSVKPRVDLARLQSNIEMIGPFRVPIGSEEVSLFVREREIAVGGRYELDYYACGGRRCFQIRERIQD